VYKDYFVVRAISQASGEWLNLGHQNAKTPEPVDMRFGKGDYVGNITHTFINDDANQSKSNTNRKI